MREDLIPQLLIVKWFGLSIVENNTSVVNSWLSKHESHIYALVTAFRSLLNLPGFLDALKQLPNQDAINQFLQSNSAVEQQLSNLLQVNQKKKAKQNPNAKRPTDLTDVAAAWYNTNPPKLADAEIDTIKVFLVDQAKRKVCCYGLNALGIVSPALAKFILDDPTVFTQVAADTVPFGAEPILALGLRAGYCEYQYATHQFFIERFLQFAGDSSVPRPANLRETSAPAHAIQAILLRTGYYKTIQVAIGSEAVRRHIFCDAVIQSGLLTKVIDQVLKPEKHERYGLDLDKSQEAKTILNWDALPWLSEEKIFGLAAVANYCVSTKHIDEQVFDIMKNAPVTAKTLFVRNSQQLIALRNHAAGNPNILEPSVAFAYVTTPAFDNMFSHEIKQVLLLAAHEYVVANFRTGVAIPHSQARLYVRACMAVMVALQNANDKFLLKINNDTLVIHLLLPVEKLSLEEVNFLLTLSTLEQVKEIKSIFKLLLFVFKLASENNTSDAAILLHWIAQHTDIAFRENATFFFMVLANKEQAFCERTVAPQAFFPGSKNNNITAQFYCYLHCSERKDASGDLLQKLFKANVERYVELVTANPLAHSKEFLPAGWLVELPTLLVKVKDKPAVLQKMLDLYEVLNESNGEHFTWLKALHHFYKQEVAEAATLFRRLKESKSSVYENEASKFLENCKSTVVNPVSQEKQEKLVAHSDSLNPL